MKATTDKYIQVHCPICGEGKAKHKARGFILKSDPDKPAGYYCHNDESCARSFGDFLDFIGKDKSAYYSTFRYNRVEKFKKKRHIKKIDNTQEMDDSSKEFLGEVEDKPFGLDISLKPITDTVEMTLRENSTKIRIHPAHGFKRAYNYLINRGFTEDQISGKVWFAPKIEAIIIPFQDGKGNMYGYQSRNIYEKYFHNELFDDNPKIYGLYEMWQSDTQIMLFESIFNAWSVDSTSVGAIIGTTIANDMLMNELLARDAYICLDPDKKGRLESIKYMKYEFKVLKHIRRQELDFNDMLQNGKSRKDILQYINENINEPSARLEMELRLNR